MYIKEYVFFFGVNSNAFIISPSFQESKSVIKIPHSDPEVTSITSSFNCFNEVKHTLINKFEGFGFYSIAIQGLEADDIAYYSSKIALNNNVSTLLYSIDSDWITFNNSMTMLVNDSDDFRLNKLMIAMDNILKINDGMESKLTLYEYGILSEIYSKSHNNIKRYTKEISLLEFMVRFKLGYDNLPDFNRVKSYFNAMDFDSKFDLYKDFIQDRLLYNPYESNIPSIAVLTCGLGRAVLIRLLITY